MNDMGCEIMASSYRKLVSEGKMTENEAKLSIEVYDFLKDKIHDGVIYRLFDTGYFNGLLKSYVKGALEGAGVDENTKEAVNSELHYLLDTMTSREVDKKF
jgi:hypothetical protein